MQKSKIEWCNYTINPVKGLCPVGCSYCYARRIYKRFKWDETIRLDMDGFLYSLDNLPKKPSRIFVGSTIELFGNWVKPEWMRRIFNQIAFYPEHTFIFLTKCPENLIKWSPFPENCYVGVSATNHEQYKIGLYYLRQIEARIRFFSFEPLLHRIDVSYGLLDWLIIGAQTPASPSTAPKIEWIKEIVEATDEVEIPVFLKNNLKSLFWKNINVNLTDGFMLPEWAGKLISDGRRVLRQEFPKIDDYKIDKDKELAWDIRQEERA